MDVRSLGKLPGVVDLAGETSTFAKIFSVQTARKIMDGSGGWRTQVVKLKE